MNFFSALFVLYRINISKFSSYGFFTVPSRQFRSNGVGECNNTFCIRYNDAVSDAFQNRSKPLLLMFQFFLRLMFIQRQIQSRSDITLIERFKYVPIRIGLTCLFQRLLIGVCSQKNNRNIVRAENRRRRVNTGHGSSQRNVHQDDIGRECFGGADSLLSGSNISDN